MVTYTRTGLVSVRKVYKPQVKVQTRSSKINSDILPVWEAM